MLATLATLPRLFVKQAFEIGEIFGFETRNKYRICGEDGRDLAFAAEQQKGLFGFIFRQTLGHWRSFEIHFYDMNRQPFMTAHHPFRWFFQCLEVRDTQGRSLGMIERRFTLLHKRFSVHGPQGQILFTVVSPFWRLWTFPFVRQGQEWARVAKKWSGFGYELFTDRDTFLVEYLDPSLGTDERALILAASFYIDLMYFERKGSGGALNVIGD